MDKLSDYEYDICGARKITVSNGLAGSIKADDGLPLYIMTDRFLGLHYILLC